MHAKSLYMDVYKQILISIQSGEYPENSPLPAERFLCDKYHVSRSTIRRALDQLKSDGHIYTIHGNGTFIKPQVFIQPLTKFYSFTDELKNSNILIHNEIINYELIRLKQSEAEQLNHPASSFFHKITRLRSAKDYPLMLETTYLPKSRFIKVNLEVLSKGSLYEFLRNTYSFHVDQATETFRPVMPRLEEKTMLHIPSSVPCILLERFSYEDGLLIEYTKSIVRGDKYIFRVDLANIGT